MAKITKILDVQSGATIVESSDSTLLTGVTNLGPSTVFYSTTNRRPTSADTSVASGATVFVSHGTYFATSGTGVSKLLVAYDDLVSPTGITLRPSGDTSGVQDPTWINAALIASTCVTLTGGTFWLASSIVIPSNTTLIVQDATVKLITNANCNMVMNSNQNSTGNTNIRVRGIGNAVFNGNAVNQSAAGGNAYDTIGFFFVNVTDLRVEDLTLGPMRKWVGVTQKCSRVRWSRIHYAQDVSTANQDGIDVGPGSSDVVIENVTGASGDDFCSIYAHNTSSSIHPYVQGLTNAQRNVSDITVRNAKVDVGINAFRINAGDGSTITNCHFSNIENINPNANSKPVIKFGIIDYVTTQPTDETSMTNIHLKGYKGPAKYLIAADGKASNIHVSDVTIIGDFTRLLGFENDGTSFNPNIKGVVMDGIWINNTSAAGAMIGFSSASGVGDQITLRNVSARFATAVLVHSGGGPWTNHTITDIHINSMNAGILRSVNTTDTGWCDNIQVDTFTSGGATVHYSATAAQGLRLGPNMPDVLSGDVAPAPRRGSIIFCANGKDPTGGASTLPGQWLGDGTVWNRVVTVAN